MPWGVSTFTDYNNTEYLSKANIYHNFTQNHKALNMLSVMPSNNKLNDTREDSAVCQFIKCSYQYENISYSNKQYHVLYNIKLSQ